MNSLRTSLSTAPTLYVGVALSAVAIAVYGASGYGGWIVVVWFVGLLLIATQLLATSGRLGPVAGRDVLAPFLLMLAFAPLYLGRLYTWPVQVSSDELAIMEVAKRYAAQPGVDLFGLSDYFGDPAGQLVAWGKLGGFFGGVDLEHMRLLHALCGLLIIGISYALFRQLLPMGWAVLGSVVLGLNHTLLMMSRLAMKENLPLLLEVSALTLLLFGLRRQNRFSTFVGGAIAGLGVYVHYSGRLFFPLWILFLVVLAIAYRRSLGLGRIAQAGAVALAAYALVVTPYAIAYQKASPDLKAHTQEANLLTAKGRKFQQAWVFAPTPWAGYRRNVVNGLTAFNYGRQDHAWIYLDKGHGIVDPLTGVLLWVGVLALLVRVVRRRGPPWALLPLTSFLALWLIYAFVVGQAPDYSRMLIALPFVAYLVAEAVRALAETAQSLLSARPRLAPALPLAAGAAAVLAIGVWNGFIGWDYIDTGQKTGDAIGSTGRYVAKYSSNPKQRFFVAGDQTRYQYYDWGWPSAWEDRIRFFASNPDQFVGVIDWRQLGQFSSTAPFTVFTRNDLWSQVQSQFESRYPDAQVHRITPDGRLLAVNVT